MLRRSKSILPTIARACLVSTFIEDGIRMWFQWSDQRDYMNIQWGCGYIIATLFVITNMLGQLIGSGLVLTRFYVSAACATLFGTVVLQVHFHYYQYFIGLNIIQFSINLGLNLIQRNRLTNSETKVYFKWNLDSNYNNYSLEIKVLNDCRHSRTLSYGT